MFASLSFVHLFFRSFGCFFDFVVRAREARGGRFVLPSRVVVYTLACLVVRFFSCRLCGEEGDVLCVLQTQGDS